MCKSYVRDEALRERGPVSRSSERMRGWSGKGSLVGTVQVANCFGHSHSETRYNIYLPSKSPLPLHHATNDLDSSFHAFITGFITSSTHSDPQLLHSSCTGTTGLRPRDQRTPHLLQCRYPQNHSFSHGFRREDSGRSEPHLHSICQG